jgi:hypothetical protein
MKNYQANYLILMFLVVSAFVARVAGAQVRLGHQAFVTFCKKILQKY